MKWFRYNFILFLSFCLLNLQLGVQGIYFSPVYAADGDTQTNTETETGNIESADDVDVSQIDTTIDSSSAEASMKSSAMVSVLTMIAIGVVTAMLYTACRKLTGDMWVAVAGAVVYLSGELYALFKYEDISKKIEINADKEGGDNANEQYESLKKQRDSYLNNAATAKMKSIIQSAAGVAFMAASAWALTSHYMIVAASKVCDGAINLGEKFKTKTILACNSNTLPSSCSVEIVPCAQGITAKKTLKMKQDLIMSSLFDSLGSEAAKNSLIAYNNTAQQQEELCVGSFKAVKTIIKPGCVKYHKLIDSQVVACGGLKVNTEVSNNIQLLQFPKKCIANSNQKMKPRFDNSLTSLLFSEHIRIIENPSAIKLSDADALEQYIAGQMTLKEKVIANLKLISKNGMGLFVSNANAFGFDKGARILGLAVAGLAAFAIIQFSNKKLMDRWIAKPFGRSIGFAGLGALAFISAALTSKVSKEMKKQAEKIDDILKQMDKRAKELNLAGDPDDRTDTSNNTGSTFDVTPPPIENIQEFDVSIPDGQKIPCATPSCSDLSKPITQGISGIPSLSPEMASAALTAGGLADSFQGKDKITSDTLDKAGFLSGKKSAVNKKLAKLRNLFNKLRKKNGQKPFNFQGATKGLLNKMYGATRKAINSNPSNMGSLQSALGSSLAVPEKDGDDEISELIDTAFDDASYGSYSGGKDFSMGGLDDDPFGKRDFSIDQDKLAKDLDKLSKRNVNDIVGSKGASIFKVISVRYLKSAFPKLLKQR